MPPTDSPPPIACTLPGPAFAARTSRLSALAARALVARRPVEDGHRLTFTDTPEVEADLRGAIAAEAACCPFLTMDLTRTPDGLELVLTGPPDATPVIAALFA
jgi:hypothetical protein